MSGYSIRGVFVRVSLHVLGVPFECISLLAIIIRFLGAMKLLRYMLTVRVFITNARFDIFHHTGVTIAPTER